jgi:hypothetical protein
LDEVLAERVQRLIELLPTFGYRRLWTLLRFGEGILINRMAAYRVLRLNGWFVHQRAATPRQPAKGSRVARDGAMNSAAGVITIASAPVQVRSLAVSTTRSVTAPGAA